ncbi:MAG: hypothetical protein ABSD68_03790 [Candidatus Micrarchaeales archaeon]|jgi:hypothetical protein
MAEEDKQIFEKLKKEGIWLSRREDGKGGYVYTLEICPTTSSSLDDMKNCTIATEVAKKHGVEFYHKDEQQGEGLSKVSKPILGVECTKDKIYERAVSLLEADQKLFEALKKIEHGKPVKTF